MVSSPGARCYLHGPAYGAGKAGIDKMSADMAVDLKKHQVAAVSLWAALTLTERSQVVMKACPGEYDAVMANAVHPEFMGRLLDALLNDPRLLERSGTTFYAAELAAELKVPDIDGRQPPSDRAFLGEPAQVTGAVIGGG
jgi:NAD(P)-dependent dehydrogenase (short-subunit alcohol dehydrogenase family)